MAKYINLYSLSLDTETLGKLNLKFVFAGFTSISLNRQDFSSMREGKHILRNYKLRLSGMDVLAPEASH